MFFCEEHKAEFVKGFFYECLGTEMFAKEKKINLTLIHTPYHQNMLPSCCIDVYWKVFALL